MCWNKGRLCWKIEKLFYFCHLEKLVRPETVGSYYVCPVHGKSHGQLPDDWEMSLNEHDCRNNLTDTKYYFKQRNEQYLDTSENRLGVPCKFWNMILVEGWRRSNEPIVRNITWSQGGKGTFHMKSKEENLTRLVTSCVRLLYKLSYWRKDERQNTREEKTRNKM